MLEQIIIGALSITAIYLLAGEGGPMSKWGCLCGFIAQPFWFHVGIERGVYVISVMSAMYGYSYARGTWREWRLGEWVSRVRGR